MSRKELDLALGSSAGMRFAPRARQNCPRSPVRAHSVRAGRFMSYERVGLEATTGEESSAVSDLRSVWAIARDQTARCRDSRLLYAEIPCARPLFSSTQRSSAPPGGTASLDRPDGRGRDLQRTDLRRFHATGKNIS